MRTKLVISASGVVGLFAASAMAFLYSFNMSPSKQEGGGKVMTVGELYYANSSWTMDTVLGLFEEGESIGADAELLYRRHYDDFKPEHKAAEVRFFSSGEINHIYISNKEVLEEL